MPSRFRRMFAGHRSVPAISAFMLAQAIGIVVLGGGTADGLGLLPVVWPIGLAVYLLGRGTPFSLAVEVVLVFILSAFVTAYLGALGDAMSGRMETPLKFQPLAATSMTLLIYALPALVGRTVARVRREERAESDGG